MKLYFLFLISICVSRDYFEISYTVYDQSGVCANIELVSCNKVITGFETERGFNETSVEAEVCGDEILVKAKRNDLYDEAVCKDSHDPFITVFETSTNKLYTLSVFHQFKQMVL